MKIEINNPEVRSWIKGETIIASGWNEKEGNLKVITKRGQNYILTRFFYLGEKIQTFQDISSTVDHFINKLFNYYEN